MIRNFGDHAANERTFLAWVRTAIAVMAFGFLVETFDLFLEIAAPSLSDRALSRRGQAIGSTIGLALICFAVAIVALATVRFLLTRRAIDSGDVKSNAGSRVDIALAMLLMLLGCALALYVSHAFMAAPPP